MEQIRIREKFVVDKIIYTVMSAIFSIIIIFIESLFLEIIDFMFLTWFRIGSVIFNLLLWSSFEKTRRTFERSLEIPKYWSSVFAFILVIQVFYILRLVVFSSHFNNLYLYISVVLISSFIIAPGVVFIKEKIFKKMEKMNIFKPLI